MQLSDALNPRRIARSLVTVLVLTLVETVVAPVVLPEVKTPRAEAVDVSYASATSGTDVVVPAGVYSITLTARGGAGGTGGADSVQAGTSSSVVGYTSATFAVNPGDRITMYPGGAGGNGSTQASGTGGGAGGAASIVTQSNTKTPSMKFNGTWSDVAFVNGGAGGPAGSGGSSGGGAGGGAGSIILINEDVAMVAAGGGGGAGGSGAVAQSWNGTYVSSGSAKGADGVNGGTCGSSDGGGSGGGGGGWQGGAAGAVTRPTGGECQGVGGSRGQNFVSNSATNTPTNSYISPNGAGFITYDFIYKSETTCSPTSQTVDIYTVVRFTATETCRWQVPAGVTTVDLFMVGGGGGGAGDGGPGGNGGFALSRTAVPVVENSTMRVKVGYGGAESNWAITSSAYFGDSSTVVTSTGAVYSALGGGTAGNSPSQAASNPVSAPNGSFAGGKGGDGAGCFNVGTAGKRGISNYFYGTLNTYSGGGGAGACPNGAATTAAAAFDGGGAGGFASSSSVNQPGSNGTDGTGGGGGGGTASGTGLKLPGGKGGSGVILIRYATNVANAFPASLTSAVQQRWIASDFQNLDSARQGFIDSSGNFTSSRTINGTVTIDTATIGNGSSKSFVQLKGDTNAYFNLENLPTANNYTLFSIAKYQANSGGRIVTSSDQTWISGFWAGNTGVAYHNGWLSDAGYGRNDVWALSADQLNTYRFNGATRINRNDNAMSIGNTLGINNSRSEVSNWQLGEVLVFNRELTPSEIILVENYLSRVYGISLTPNDYTVETDTAASFTGSTFLWAKGSPRVNLSDTFTVEAWVKTTSTCDGAHWCYVYAQENGLVWAVTGGILYYALYGANTAWEWTSTEIKVASGEWHHIALSKELVGNRSNSIKAYLDGTLRFTKIGSPYVSSTAAPTVSDANTVYPANTRVHIGYRSADGLYFYGNIDEVRVWRGYRTESEIQNDMKTYGAIDNPNLRLYMDFNKSSSTSTLEVVNKAPRGEAAFAMMPFGTVAYTDVKTVVVDPVYTRVVFPRTYLNENGGWKVPDSVTAVALLLVGGGGGGAGAYTAQLDSGGGGGGGGGVFAPASAINLTNNRIIPVVIGAGGVGGPASATQSAAAGSTGQTSFFATLSAGGGGGGGYVTSTNANGLNGTSAGGGGGASNYLNAYNSGFGGLSPPTPLAGQAWQGFDGGNGAVFVSGTSSTGDAGAGGGASTSATRTSIGGGIQSSLSGTPTAYGRGGSARGVTGYSFASVAPNLGTGGSGQYGSSAPGGNGSAGVAIVRWITAQKPSFTYPTNAYLNVGMTETFTTNVAQDSATAMLTRTFRWESTTGGSNGTFTTIKAGTGAANAAFSWVPTDTSTSGSQYLYRVVVTDSDSFGLSIVDTSTPVFAVINRTLLMSGPSVIKKQINIARNETFTISQGTPGYRYSLSPDIPGVSLDTATVGTTILRISDTATVGTFIETLTVTDSVSASVSIPITLVISAPPTLVNSNEVVTNGQVLNLDFANSASYSQASRVISDISGSKKTITAYGNPTFSDDYSGILTLNSASSQYLEFSNPDQLKNFSIEAYVRIDTALDGQELIVTSQYVSANINFALGFDVGRTVFIGYHRSGWKVYRSTATIDVGVWTHIVGTWDGSTMRLYFNGVEVTAGSYDNSVSGGDAPKGDTNQVYIGKHWNTTSTTPMSMGVVRIFNRSLTAGEIAQNYNATKDRFAFANINQVKPAQKYGQITLESFTVTSGGDTKTVTFAVGNRSGIAWDTTSTPGRINLTVQETLTPGTYFDTITVTDNFGQSTNLPIRFTISKADTLTIFVDTPTALNYTGNRALLTPLVRAIGAVGFESGTAMTPNLRFKPAGTTCATGGYCRVGDIGPGGGIVFIDTSTASSDGRIYEVAPQNWSGSDDLTTVATYCSNNNSNIGATQVGIGWGETNTNLAKSSCLGGAVARVNNFNLSNNTGYSDWFIPSKNEAIELAKIPVAAGLLDIGNNWNVGNWGYWASTEVSSSVMWAIGHTGPSFNGNGNVAKSEATKNMVRPVRAFRACWAIDTCTALLTTETPTAAGIYVISPTSGASAATLAERYSSVRYLESRMTINRIAQRPQVIPFVNVNFPDTFTVNVIEGSGNGAVTYTATNGTATGCAFDYKKLYSTTQGTCTVTVVKAGDRNYLPDTTTVGMLLLSFALNQPSAGVGSGPNIALSGATSVTLDPNVAPTISSLSTYTAQAGVTSLVITGAGFDSSNLAGITVKFWRNVFASGFTVNAQNTQITVTVPAGATTGKVVVTTPNGQAVSEFALTITP